MVSCNGCVLAANTEGTSASTSIAPPEEILVSRDSAASVKDIVFDFSEFCITKFGLEITEFSLPRNLLFHLVR